MATILETGAQSAQADHRIAGTLFRCCDCGACKPVQHSGGTGYAVDRDTDKLICYACMAKRDSDEMERTGRAVLYLSKNTDRTKWGWAPFKVGNWCGTLSFPVYGVQKSFHNFAGRDGRRDFWFTAFGREWHGVNIGDSQIAHCKALKAKTR